MKNKEKLGALFGFLAAVALIGIGFGVGFLPALPVVAVLLVLGHRYRRGLWIELLKGLAAGAIAGVLILGPGFRLAMRIVAILDPVKTPEFTIEGTLFIVVMVGGVFGGLFGSVSATLEKLAPRWLTAGLVTAGIMGLLLSSPDLRTELGTLGAGPWMNIPMFSLVVLAYSIGIQLVTNRLWQSGDNVAAPPVEVPA